MTHPTYERQALPVWLPDLGDDADGAVRQAVSDWIGSPPLRDLLASDDAALPDGSLQERLSWLDDYSAEHWDLRKGRERNLATTLQLTPDRERLVFAVAEALGLRDEQPPAHRSYDAVLVLGGLVRACIVRPAWTARLIEDGLRAGQVCALGGFRRLGGDELDLVKHLQLDEVDDEFTAMSRGVERAFGFDNPTSSEGSGGTGNADWAASRYGGVPQVLVVAAPSLEPDTRRANSADTYTWWAQELAPQLEGGRVLLVTSSIYVPFQGADATRVLALRHNVQVETVGVPARASQLGTFTQQFTAGNYVQELRSTIRSFAALIRELDARG